MTKKPTGVKPAEQTKALAPSFMMIDTCNPMPKLPPLCTDEQLARFAKSIGTNKPKP